MKLDEVGKFISGLSKDGDITPDRVLEAARTLPKGDLIHERYWGLTDTEEARRSRLDRARNDIQRFKVIVTIENIRIACPIYVRNPDKDEDQQGYTSVHNLALNHERAVENMVSELSRLQTWISRVRGITVAGGTAKVAPELPVELGDMVNTLQRLIDTLNAAPMPRAPRSRSRRATVSGTA